MTRAFVIIRKKKHYQEYFPQWEQGIVAPKLTFKALVDELHYHLRVYIKKNYSFPKIMIFLVFNIVQRILYSYAFFL